MKTRALLLAALAVAAIPAIADAQQFGRQDPGPGRGGPPIDRAMLRADANGDGIATPQERAAFQARRQALCPFAGGADAARVRRQ